MGLELKELLFYEEYEQFYMMAKESVAFREFCRKAFGEDFSQDGFSDISQIDRILPYVPKDGQAHILDIGCGNGKVLGYIQKKTGAYIHGFDYSGKAIETARELFIDNSDFRQGMMGKIEYQPEMFDVIISLDTMYFAPDMSKFADQIMRWLKSHGVFMAFYQEGDVMPKTENERTSVLAKALTEKNISYECIDISRESYDLLRRKKEAALSFKEEFEKEGNGEWFEMLVAQTDYADKSFEDYSKEMARYIYIVKK